MELCEREAKRARERYLRRVGRLLPVKPRRCDHLKIRFTGTGDAKIFSVTRILEVGSDYK